MQEKLTIARPYAEAIFELARERGEYQHWSDVMSALAAIVENPEMAGFIRDPRIGREQLAGLVVDIIGNVLDERGRNFVKLLIHNQRLGLAAQIAELFENLRLEAEGIVHVDVFAAFPLDERQQGLISRAVGSRLGKTVELAMHTDEHLIGGAVVKAGDHVIDLSIHGRLRQLTTRFS